MLRLLWYFNRMPVFAVHDSLPPCTDVHLPCPVSLLSLSEHRDTNDCWEGRQPAGEIIHARMKEERGWVEGEKATATIVVNNSFCTVNGDGTTRHLTTSKVTQVEAI